MRSTREAIETYIRAKDGNRPILMGGVFAEDAVLEMTVTGGSITFPRQSSGLEAISDTLVREFARAYENICTFCLALPPSGDASTFSCNWLVGMSEKETRNVRVGFGRYDWRFHSSTHKVTHLAISVQIMESLPPATLGTVTGWLSALPYPWCPAHLAVKECPRVPALLSIRQHLVNSSV